MHKYIYLLIITTFSCTSCCSMTRGTEQKLIIDSNPQGASVTIDGYDCGTTPQAIFLERKRPHEVLIHKEGYQSATYYLQPRMTPAIATNALMPLSGAAVGAGIGLIAVGGNTRGLNGIEIMAGAAIGLAIGTALGLVSSVIDVNSGASKTLGAERIHAEL